MSESEALLSGSCQCYDTATQNSSHVAEQCDRHGPNQQPEADVKAPPSGRKSKFRLYLTRTLFLYLAYFCLGLNIGEGGTTFLDILFLLRTDVQTGSILYTASSVGYACGALLAGVLYDMLNWDGLLFLAVFWMGSFNMAMIWCPTLWLMAIVNGLKGASFGSVDTGGNTVCLGMWKKEGSPYLQALHFSFSIGGVIAPFIAEPFLAPKRNETSQNSSAAITERYNPAYIDSLQGNDSSMPIFNLTDSQAAIVTRVQYPYMIIGGVSVLAAFPFLILFCRSCRKESKASHVNEEADDTRKDQEAATPNKELRLAKKVIMLVLLGFFYSCYVSLEAFIEGYLMTFVVKHLDWSKSEGARITSVFWGTFAAGRIIGVFMSKILTPWKMLLIDLVLVNAVFVPLWFVSKENDVIMWICIPLSGVFMATIFPTGLSWTNQRIMTVTGKVASVFVLSSTLGGIFNPMLLGYLFKNVTPMWFVYLLTIEGAVCCVVFFILTTILECTSRRSRDFKTDDIQ